VKKQYDLTEIFFLDGWIVGRKKEEKKFLREISR